MKNFLLKTLLPALVTILATTGAFSFQISYERGQHQEKLGKLVAGMTRNQLGQTQEALGKFVVNFTRGCNSH